MAGKIIWWVVSFGCAAVFFGIGVYAERLQKPMWFWSGSEVKPEEITNMKQYNRENGTMWKVYSLWFLAAGIAEIWNTYVALAFLILGCTVGIGVLVATHNRIYKKYKVR